MGVLYVKVPRPLPPNQKFLDETMAGLALEGWSLVERIIFTDSEHELIHCVRLV